MKKEGGWGEVYRAVTLKPAPQEQPPLWDVCRYRWGNNRSWRHLGSTTP